MTNAIPPEVINALPPAWQVYAGVLSALLVLIGAAGRAWHAWKTDSSAVKALVFGTNTPPALQAQVDANTIARGDTPPATPVK